MSSNNKQASDFTNLGLSAPILQTLDELGYETPTAIQEQMIPVLLSGCDVLGQAQTGTGKTAAFALPVLEKIDVDHRVPQVLVLAPTRELANQVCESFKTYAAQIKGLRTLAVYGGQDYGPQLRALKHGVHIVVGTPGRVMDHIKRGSLNLDEMKCLVLDEADEMLRMGFREDVEWVLERAPEQRQICLFSATMPAEIRAISRKFMNNTQEIIIREKTATVEATRQRYWVAAGLHKLDALSRILEVEPYDAILIFARTRMDTIEIADQLVERGFAAAALNGDIPQNQREKLISQLKSGKLNIIVATDVAARGLDVERISHVVNYDIPQDSESYVHRIGRTGRAGRKGEAILFVSPRQRRYLSMIERATRQQLTPMDIPSADEINVKRIEAFKTRISETCTDPDLDFYRKLIKEYCHENEADPLEIAAVAARMFQGDRPLLLKDKPVKHTFNQFKDDFGGPSRHKAKFGGAPRRNDDAHEEGMDRYRIEVGKDHNVLPGHIVGAIAGETGMPSRHIGRIRLFNEFSTVDLPEDMPQAMLTKLKTAVICRRQMQISLDRGPAGAAAAARRPTREKKAGDMPFPEIRTASSIPTKGRKAKFAGKKSPKRRTARR